MSKTNSAVNSKKSKKVPELQLPSSDIKQKVKRRRIEEDSEEEEDEVIELN